MPTVSVVMAVYNGSTYLRAAINSVLNQTYTDFEFVIVNDGSEDNTVEIVRSFSDPRIRLIDKAENRGLAASLNEGISLSTGIYVARMDADDLSHPQRLDAQVARLDRDKSLALIGSNYTVIDELGLRQGVTDVFTHPDDLKVALVSSNQFGHGSVMMRRSVVEGMGGYDQAAVLEDYDLWVRISHVARVANIKTPLYHWRNNPLGFSTVNRDLQLRHTWLIRDREFERLVENRRSYRLLTSFHPDGLSYLVRKATMYRNLAYLYRKRGRVLPALLMLLAAAIVAPWRLRTLLHILTVFNERAFFRWISYVG